MQLDSRSFSAESIAAEKANFSGWGTIENDPLVFSALLHAMGVRGMTVKEVYSLDAESLSQFSQLFGLIFLFKWHNHSEKSAEEQEAELKTPLPMNVWFANQTMPNSCATLALLNIALNASISDPDCVKLLPELESFKEFTRSLIPFHRGLALMSSRFLCSTHNQFAKVSEIRDSIMDLYRQSKNTAGKGDGQHESFHYIAYVPVNGALWELDGLRQRPVKICELGETLWYVTAVDEIHNRIAEYGSEEMGFSLMALARDYSDALADVAARIRPALGTLDEVISRQPADSGNELRTLLNSRARYLNIDEPTIISIARRHLKTLSSRSACELESEIETMYVDLLSTLNTAETLLATYQANEADERQYVMRKQHDYAPFLRQMIRFMEGEDFAGILGQ
ncbi:ubiquitin carboxyl-terminal hydrolase [Lipomyces japonicus]|uniref:ubiquitin carboxyl-terminal hydrolase n=1 Tax=Lipomyces japonicus TaxID=56871 RepID=UPI0034CECFE0